MFNKRKEIIEDLIKDNQNLVKENRSLIEDYQSLRKDNQRLKLDLNEAYTKNIKLNKVLEKLIIAICYSEDEKLLRTCDKILKDLEE